MSACNLIATYLSNHKQGVKIGNTSKFISLFKAVPLGSILGLLLFNIFINDMDMFTDECTLYNYADDNSLFCTAPAIDAVISNLQLDGNRAIKWFADNGMLANPEKFQFMMISRDENCSRRLILNDSTVIVSDDHVKLLGIVIDNKLHVSLHVSSNCKKASRHLNTLARISNYLDVSTRRTIYDSFVAGNFNYCPLVWHICGATNNNKIEKIQERCLRIIYKDYESTIERWLEMSNTTSLVISRLRLILLEVYKSIKHLNPKCINGSYEEKSTSYSLRYPVKVLQPKKGQRRMA